MLATFDPASVVISFGGIPLSGFADGTFLEITADNPQFTKTVGADGYTTRTKSNNYGAQVTITLAQSSPSNDILTSFLNADRIDNQGVKPLIIKDMSGRTLVFSSTAWIQQFSDITFGNELNNRSWVLDLADIDIFIGGNTQS